MTVVQYYIATPKIAITAATAKTLLELPVPANCSPQIEELIIGCDVSSAGNMLIEFGTYATAGSGGTAATPQKWRGDRSIDSAITGARYGDTTEPATFSQGTAGSLWPAILIPLPMYFPFQWPLDHELAIAESTNFGIRVTSSVTGNATLYIRWRE